jgi:hypothetical protein
MNAGDQVSVHWLNPSNSWVWTITWNKLNASGSYCFGGPSAYLPIAQFSSSLGTWWLEVYVNGQYQGHTSFTLAAPSSSPRYAGSFDGIDCSHLYGWVKDTNSPNTTLAVNVYIDSSFLATVQAADYRSDLANQGIGNHAFNYYALPANLKNGAVHSVRVTYSATGIDLPGSPKTFQNTCDTAMTISSIGGWTAGTSGNYIVLNAQWQGQPSSAPTRGKYYLYYAIDTDVVSSTNVTYWQINGSGFGSQPGSVSFSDSSITSTVTNWTNSQITIGPSFVPWVSFGYMQNPSVAITITNASGARLTQPLPRPSGLPASTPWGGGVIGTINTRGYGQCTWYVAWLRRSQNRRIPYPSAYSITNYIDPSYVPQQWDVLDFGTYKSSTTINGVHTAVIVSPVSVSQVSNTDGSKTLTYSFAIGEMNANPAWGEQASSVNSSFLVNVSRTGIRSVMRQIKSAVPNYAIAYFR